LIAKGIHGSKIAVLTPIVVLDTVHLQNTKKDCACQADVLSADSEDCFGNFLTEIDVTEKELDAFLTESEDDNFLFGPIECVIQAIKVMRFNWPQCLIQMLQNHLQSKGLELDVLESNPLFFTAFKQKLHKEFQCSFPGYSPHLHHVNIKNFRWQVMWLWEFLVNTPSFTTLDLYQH